ncbi:glutaredoxin family protein [Candidatus Thorarchaeota archaeon]|nr:MAG: glutaredoxin family protein [Candidatus Thorarchaeota archaeon]
MEETPLAKATIYTAPECPHSKNLKEFLNEHKVDFDEKCILTSPEVVLELKNKSGQMALPTTIMGDEIFVGFDRRTERRIKRHLGV